MNLALVLGAYDLNLSTILSKLNTMHQRHLGFLKGMFREGIKSLYVLYVLFVLFVFFLGSA